MFGMLFVTCIMYQGAICKFYLCMNCYVCQDDQYTTIAHSFNISIAIGYLIILPKVMKS